MPKNSKTQQKKENTGQGRQQVEGSGFRQKKAPKGELYFGSNNFSLFESLLLFKLKLNLVIKRVFKKNVGQKSKFNLILPN